MIWLDNTSKVMIAIIDEIAIDFSSDDAVQLIFFFPVRHCAAWFRIGECCEDPLF